MKAFRVHGTFRMGRRSQPFTQEVIGGSEAEAVEKVLSLLGSRHRTKRKDIRVDEVTELQAGDAEDPVVAHLMGME